ncbi:hypothetical protein LTS18_008116, partial [Coniosporium uncinatum]
MDPQRRQGRPDEELFLNQPTATSNKPSNESPTVGPLRINKTQSPEPPHTGSASSQSQPFYKPPPLTVFPKQPTAPLPYPDDNIRSQAAVGGRVYTPLSERERSSKNSTPEQQQQTSTGRRRQSQSVEQAATISGSPRAKFSANDPNRPSVAGYGHAPASVRTESSSTGSIGDRRGHAPKPLPDSPGPETPDKEGLFQ